MCICMRWLYQASFLIFFVMFIFLAIYLTVLWLRWQRKLSNDHLEIQKNYLRLVNSEKTQIVYFKDVLGIILNQNYKNEIWEIGIAGKWADLIVFGYDPMDKIWTEIKRKINKKVPIKNGKVFFGMNSLWRLAMVLFAGFILATVVWTIVIVLLPPHLRSLSWMILLPVGWIIPLFQKKRRLIESFK
jgi:low temperature requirement protein LtrA